MELISLPLVLLLISNIHSSSEALPKATVSVTPDNPVFIGETVTLKCEIEDQYSDWRYVWYKDPTKVSNSGRYTVNRDSLTISGVIKSDQKFSCRAERDGRPKTSLSSSYADFTVKALPRATVRVTPDRSVFTGETVTLKCEIENQYRSLNWTYQWSKGTTKVSKVSQKFQRYTVNRDSLTFTGVNKSDQDKFSCSAEIHGRPKTSLSSSAVDLNVKALPRATVKVPYSPVFTGETVTLKCEIENQYRSLNWRYQWYKGRTGTSVFKENIYTISSPSDQDEFWCRGERVGRPSSSQDSDHVTLSVKALPKATVRVTSDSPVFIGETVTLKCEIEDQYRSLNWTYQWYKYKAKVFNSVLNTVNRNSLTINGVTVYDRHDVSCRADIYGRPQTSLSSSDVHLTVNAIPIATVIVTPDRSVFTGETVTLKCEIDQYSNWRYVWYNGRTGTSVFVGNIYTIRSPSDQDKFRCRGERDGRPSYSHYSNPVTLFVKALPRVTVRVTPKSPVLIGETVTLKCEIEDQYSDWRYQYSDWRYLWYKDTIEVFNSERYTVDRDLLTINRVNESDQNEFSCSAEIHGRPQTSLSSSSVHLSVKERPTPEVSVWPADHVFRGETVNLTCIINRGVVSSWQYSWYKDSSLYHISDLQNYTIRYFNESHEGKYTCRGNKTNGPQYSDISDAVTLTVSVASHVKMLGFNMITFLLAASLSISVSDSFQIL